MMKLLSGGRGGRQEATTDDRRRVTARAACRLTIYKTAVDDRSMAGRGGAARAPTCPLTAG